MPLLRRTCIWRDEIPALRSWARVATPCWALAMRAIRRSTVGVDCVPTRYTSDRNPRTRPLTCPVPRPGSREAQSGGRPLMTNVRSPGRAIPMRRASSSTCCGFCRRVDSVRRRALSWRSCWISVRVSCESASYARNGQPGRDRTGGSSPSTARSASRETRSQRIPPERRRARPLRAVDFFLPRSAAVRGLAAVVLIGGKLRAAAARSCYPVKARTRPAA